MMTSLPALNGSGSVCHRNRSHARHNLPARRLNCKGGRPAGAGELRHGRVGDGAGPGRVTLMAALQFIEATVSPCRPYSSYAAAATYPYGRTSSAEIQETQQIASECITLVGAFGLLRPF